MGGGPSGPSKGQLQAQRAQETALMQMQQNMMQQQMAAQQSMLDAQLAAAERQRLAAEQAAKEAATQAQSTAAQQAAAQNMQTVGQQISGKNTMQELADRQARERYQKAMTTGAENVTGGFDLAAAKQSALTNLGAASGTLPQTRANVIGSMAAVNPAMTTAATNEPTRQNLFNLPSTTGLTFGGT